MKKLLLVIVLVVVLATLVAPSVLGHDAPPCNDSGEPGNSDYALHHIINATANGSHVPGVHNGYSLCIPQAGWK